MTMIKNTERHFRCKICSFSYDEKEWAEKCYNWCKEYKSCNMEITKHADSHK
ncbi:MAG: hypothetical protein AABY14_02890 [Nanoarchaeota archaeon]|jgi:hypothetical protein